MFIPKQVAYLSSSIGHYERWFLMRADFVAPPFASEPRPHPTGRCSEPLAAVMTSAQHVYEVRPRKDRRGVDLISDVLPFGGLWYGGPSAIGNAIRIR
jgi:hypothetical protein